MKRFLSIIIFFILIQGCKSGIPKDIIQPNKMEKVLFDIHVVDGYIGTMINQDTTKIIASSYYNGIYKKHGIDSALLNKSMNYYYTHPVILNDIYTNVEKVFTAEKEKYDKKIAVAGQVSNLPSLVVLTNLPPLVSKMTIEINPFNITTNISRL
jgi:DNA polymerase sigma